MTQLATADLLDLLRPFYHTYGALTSFPDVDFMPSACLYANQDGIIVIKE